MVGRMCKNPRLLITKTGRSVTIACQVCSLCKANYLKDWHGRCRAERETCVDAHAITLTYGPDLETGEKDHVRSRALVYDDVQKMFKRLRFAGYEFRYLVAGEFGSKKNRSHWHLLMFWKNKVPPHEIQENFMQEEWPYGYSWWDEVNDASIKYVIKYILKDRGDKAAVRNFYMSKRPPLGADYICLLAERYVDQQLAPQSETYRFPEVRVKVKVAKGEAPRTKPVEFYMSIATKRLFIEHYLKCWYAKYNRHPPESQMIEDYLDSKANPLPAEVVYRRGFRTAPRVPYCEGVDIRFDDKLNAYYCLLKDGSRVFWSFDQEGEMSWEKVLVSESEALRRRTVAPLLKNPEVYRKGRDGPTGPYD